MFKGCVDTFLSCPILYRNDKRRHLERQLQAARLTLFRGFVDTWERAKIAGWKSVIRRPGRWSRAA